MKEIYDLVIIGGGTAGCAAAYIAGKNNLKTIVVEKNQYLGGAITSSLVIPVMKSSDNQINTNFYNKLIEELSKISGQICYLNNPGWFNPELTKIVLDKLLQDVNVEVLFNTYPTEITTNNRRIEEITLNNNHKIKTKHLIDSTGNSYACQLLNCNFIDDSNKTQPMTLRFIMNGIETKEFGKWLLEIDKDRDVTTVETINNETHLSTAYTWDKDKTWALAPYFDDAVNNGILLDTDRNYFQIFTVAGMKGAIAFNCPRILKEQDTSKASQQARATIYRISEFCKKYFKGFENAYISNIADSIGVRVSKRIIGKYIYKSQDLRTGKTFENPALISNYPIDIHGHKKDNSTLEKVGEYQLPIESLISNDYENLFVAGRNLSADFEAQAALRVQASCFSMGEAVAKHIAKLLNK